LFQLAIIFQMAEQNNTKSPFYWQNIKKRRYVPDVLHRRFSFIHIVLERGERSPVQHSYLHLGATVPYRLYRVGWYSMNLYPVRLLTRRAAILAEVFLHSKRMSGIAARFPSKSIFCHHSLSSSHTFWLKITSSVEILLWLIWGCAWLIDEVWIEWLDILTPYTHHSELPLITRFTVHRLTHTLMLSVFTSRILATDL
jgi:hypothetical protein